MDDPGRIDDPVDAARAAWTEEPENAMGETALGVLSAFFPPAAAWCGDSSFWRICVDQLCRKMIYIGLQPIHCGPPMHDHHRWSAPQAIEMPTIFIALLSKTASPLYNHHG
jgi:hypothetical protein